MDQGFGHEIGKSLLGFMVLVFVVGCAVGIGMYFALCWMAHHVAIHWK